MRIKITLIALITVCLFPLLCGCGPKVPETTPRYDKGVCMICSPLGHSEEAGKCFFCKGTAVCTFCKGKGKRQVGEKTHFYEETCAFCAGSGKCHYCGGLGKCKICGGTGKYTPLKFSAEPGKVPETDTAPSPR
jgi:hypothetical protein